MTAPAPVATFENRFTSSIPTTGEGEHSHSHELDGHGHGHGHDHGTEEHGHTHEHLEHAGMSSHASGML
jgi:hypothetical protein